MNRAKRRSPSDPSYDLLKRCQRSAQPRVFIPLMPLFCKRNDEDRFGATLLSNKKKKTNMRRVQSDRGLAAQLWFVAEENQIFTGLNTSLTPNHQSSSVIWTQVKWGLMWFVPSRFMNVHFFLDIFVD